MPAYDCGVRSANASTRIPWTEDEVARLAAAIEASRDGHGRIKWSRVARHVGTRSRVQCYQRYNYTGGSRKFELGRAGPSRRAWTVDETVELLRWHQTYGNRWKLYRERLPTRTEAEIKGRFASLQRGIASRNSDVWRMTAYAPYRDYLWLSVANKNGCSRCNLPAVAGLDSDRQIKLVQRFKHKLLPTRQRAPRPIQPNIATFPVFFKSALLYGSQGSSLVLLQRPRQMADIGTPRRRRRLHRCITL